MQGLYGLNVSGAAIQRPVKCITLRQGDSVLAKILAKKQTYFLAKLHLAALLTAAAALPTD